MGGLGSGRKRARADVTELPRLTLAPIRASLRGRSGRVRLMVNESPVECVAVPHAFGGVRWWLLCPRCQHRRAALYGRRITVRIVRAGEDGSESVDGRSSYSWGCRVCYRLGYPSQRLAPYHLYHYKQRLVWRRLGGSDDTFDDFSVWRWPKRPKGMRRATQARLQDEYDHQVEKAEAYARADFARLLGRLGIVQPTGS
jgi:hypothetical protein